MWFLAGVWLYVCTCVSDFQRFKLDIDMKFGTPVKQSQSFNRDYFNDNWCPIYDFMGFWIFWKMSVVALTSIKFELSS